MVVLGLVPALVLAVKYQTPGVEVLVPVPVWWVLGLVPVLEEGLALVLVLVPGLVPEEALALVMELEKVLVLVVAVVLDFE